MTVGWWGMFNDMLPLFLTALTFLISYMFTCCDDKYNDHY